MMQIGIIQIILLLILGIAVVSDLRWRKIPNWLTGSSIVIALSLHTFMNQSSGFLFSLEGAAVGFGIFMAMYLLGWMGAGDVKLFAGVGSFLGPGAVASTAILVAITGGVVAVVTLGFYQGWKNMSFRLWSLVQSIILTQSVPRLVPVEDKAPKVPYALAIGVGTVFSWYWHPLG